MTTPFVLTRQQCEDYGADDYTPCIMCNGQERCTCLDEHEDVGELYFGREEDEEC